MASDLQGDTCVEWSETATTAKRLLARRTVICKASPLWRRMIFPVARRQLRVGCGELGFEGAGRGRTQPGLDAR